MKKYFLSFIVGLIGVLSVFAQQEVVQNSPTTIVQSGRYTPAPVVFSADTLFYIDVRQVSLTPEERAKNISARLKKVFNEDFYQIYEIATSTHGAYVDIVCGDYIIMSLSEEDAVSQDKTVQELAENYIERINHSFEKAHQEKNLLTVLIRIGLVLLVLTGIWLMILLIQRAHKYVEKFIGDNSSKWIKDFSYKGYTFLTAKQELNVLTWILMLIKWAVIIILIYLLLPLLFSIFPFTRGWAAALFRLIWSPFKTMMYGIWNYLPQLFSIIVIYIVFKYLIKIVKYFFREIEAGKLKINGFHRDWAIPTFSLVRLLLYAFMFVLIFPNLPGSESPIFRGVSVFLGLLVSLGSSAAIGNMVAGFVITYMRPFKIGDKIQLGEVTGDVLEKTLLVTRLRTTFNEEITIPNSSILSKNTTNFSAMARKEGLILHTAVNINYKYDWKEVHAALIEAALRTKKILKDKKPFVLQTALDDFYVEYTINAYTHEPNALSPIYGELHRHIMDVCNEKGIEIMSPHFLLAERDKPMGKEK